METPKFRKKHLHKGFYSHLKLLWLMQKRVNVRAELKGQKQLLPPYS